MGINTTKSKVVDKIDKLTVTAEERQKLECLKHAVTIAPVNFTSEQVLNIAKEFYNWVDGK